MDDSKNTFGHTQNVYSPEINVPPVSTPQPTEPSQPVVEQPVINPQPPIFSQPAMESPVVEQPVINSQSSVEQPPVSPDPLMEQPVISPQPPVVEQPPVFSQPAPEQLAVPTQDPLTQQPNSEQPVVENNFATIEETAKKKKFPIIPIIIGILLILAAGFFFGKKYLFEEDGLFNSTKKTENDEGNGLVVVDENGNAPKEEVKKAANMCESEQKEILDLIKMFEDAQKEKDANAVLSLFTEPEVKEERDELSNLDGSDSNLPPRLYNNVSTNYRTDGYVIVGNPAIVEGTLNCYVLVEESRAYFGGPEEPEYKSPLPKNFSIIVQKVGEKWLIQSYQSTEENIKKTKYAGFLMEFTQ